MNILFCITIFLISHPYVLILVSYYIKVSKAMNRSLGTSTLCQTVSTAIFTCYFCNCIPYVFYMFYRRIAIATIFKCSDTPHIASNMVAHAPHCCCSCRFLHSCAASRESVWRADHSNWSYNNNTKKQPAVRCHRYRKC